MNDTAVRLYAIAKNVDDGLVYLHFDRALAPNGRVVTSTTHLPGFPTEAAARDHARGLGAADSDIAPNPGVR